MASTDRFELGERHLGDAPASDRLRGATVLITGGTGSFGHAMTRRLLGLGCGEIRIFSRDEAKQDTMRHSIGAHNVRFHIGDVRDRDAVQRAVRGADYVFHAAALKQVPSCEFFPLEAVQTNVLGGANVVRAAIAAGSKCVVCLSTDKAVEPVNAMGMSKALMEKVVSAEARSLNDNDTVVCTVRYGNVLYSRGSVVPLFIQQALAGEPLTITDTRMTRFMMSLDEAIDLVEYAFLNAAHGDTFIRKAPAALIADVADIVGTMFCGQPKTRIIGIRHGEKLHETLASASELRHAHDHGNYLRVPTDSRNLDYDKYFTDGEDNDTQTTAYTSNTAHRMNHDEITKMLLSIPEYTTALNNTHENAYAHTSQIIDLRDGVTASRNAHRTMLKAALVSIDDERWDAALSGAWHDIYHTRAYVRAEARRLGATAGAVVVEDGPRSFLLPLLVREVNDSGTRDAVSPYGYPGPVLSRAATETPGFVDQCVDAVVAALVEQEICSVFVRLHPLINDDLGRTLVRHRLHRVGSTVSIDLNGTDEELWAGIRKGHTNAIHQARRAGFAIEITAADEQFEAFMEVYADTLSRLSVSDEFGRRHLERLAHTDRTFIATARIDGVVAGAYMLFEYGGLIHLHLGGTRSAFMKPSPSNLLIYEIAQWGKARGNDRVHLGGGVGGSATDSLFRFKAGFSRERHAYHALRLIIDERRYEQLVRDRAIDLAVTSSELVSSGFFPAYRASVAISVDEASTANRHPETVGQR